MIIGYSLTNQIVWFHYLITCIIDLKFRCKFNLVGVHEEEG